MDKVFSTRIDEEMINKINHFVRNKAISKKSLIEKALQAYFKNTGARLEQDILNHSFGTWKRDETAGDTWSHGREKFTKGFQRYQDNGENR